MDQRLDVDHDDPIEITEASAAAGGASAKVLNAAADVVLTPVEDYPRINLRAQGEPWEKRRHAGKLLRGAVPHSAHAAWVVPDDRPDPVSIIEKASEGRQKNLIPLRVGRMARSPFAFLRGSAHVMGWDLARTPKTNISVVIDGDAHISNFGLFGTPQHEIVLDLNDFDEVTIGPWEWDLKRLVASVVAPRWARSQATV